jgi:hypothetical protein
MTNHFKSEIYEDGAHMYLRKNAIWLRASHDNDLLATYRGVCLKIAQEAAEEATRAFATARAFRIRGE